MKKNRNEIIDYINSLEEYQGYVQFSHRPIDKQTDIFYEDKKVEVKDEEGFIYEAHFSNGSESVTIKQINDSWIVSKTDINTLDKKDIQEYISDIENFNYKIQMAQIWEVKEDELCENMPVKKLSKVVFIGFKGESK